MQVTKNRLDAQLRSKYFIASFLGLLFSRTWGINLIQFLLKFTHGIKLPGLDIREQYIPSQSGGPDIRIRILKPLDAREQLPCMLFFHGGGYLFGNPETSFSLIKKIIDTRACVVVAPEYRESMHAPYPAGFNDCFDTLLWAKDHGETLDVRADRFILAGPSAGGGLTAAIALKARDTKELEIAFQMPLYPMLDDRQITASSKQMAFYPWNAKTNRFAWDRYLKDLKQAGTDIPAYAAAARTVDYAGLPPTITFVGDLEPFLDETKAFVQSLEQAGVPVAFEVFTGCFHAFDQIVPDADVSQRATRFLLDAYAKFYDQSFGS